MSEDKNLPVDDNSWNYWLKYEMEKNGDSFDKKIVKYPEELEEPDSYDNYRHWIAWGEKFVYFVSERFMQSDDYSFCDIRSIPRDPPDIDEKSNE